MTQENYLKYQNYTQNQFIEEIELLQSQLKEIEKAKKAAIKVSANNVEIYESQLKEERDKLKIQETYINKWKGILIRDANCQICPECNTKSVVVVDCHSGTDRYGCDFEVCNCECLNCGYLFSD